MAQPPTQGTEGNQIKSNESSIGLLGCFFWRWLNRPSIIPHHLRSLWYIHPPTTNPINYQFFSPSGDSFRPMLCLFCFLIDTLYKSSRHGTHTMNAPFFQLGPSPDHFTTYH